KFTEKGYAFVDVELEADRGKEALVRISVTDTGIGIPKDTLGGLFTKFAQADASTTRKFGGTGLGLAISKQLAELMGGSLGVRSEPDHGSTFWFTLPLPIDLNASFRAAPAPSVSLEGARVCVVDDQELNRRVLQEQLLGWKMRVDLFESGEKALEGLSRAKAGGDPYRVALLDFMLPGMDGETLARKILADPELKDTLLVMLTSVGLRGDAAIMRQAGLSAYLVKPVRQAHLSETLAQLLGKQGSGRLPHLITARSIIEARAERKSQQAEAKARFDARVLVAEDNVVNQKVAVRMLEKLGCRVDVAANGKAAVEMAGSQPYDLVLMDCQMPEMDGYEATAEIRRLQEGAPRRLPIVAMTANAMQGEREKCLAAGMDDHIAKPVKLEILRAALKRWTAAHEGSADAAHESSADAAREGSADAAREGSTDAAR
ncbi:MAG: response regulator, partial [Planctomycetes bacterium]|nr:response regulator [Planctomycetota bacterium]